MCSNYYHYTFYSAHNNEVDQTVQAGFNHIEFNKVSHDVSHTNSKRKTGTCLMFTKKSRNYALLRIYHINYVILIKRKIHINFAAVTI